MAWIKRNLFFLVGAVVSLASLVFAGYYNYKGWKHKEEESENLNQQYDTLRRLNEAKPHPGFGRVDNIKLARVQADEMREVLARLTNFFLPPPPIPAGGTNITSSQFSSALRDTLSDLARAATDAGVQLPPDFKFSFTQQHRTLSFAEGSLEPLARQLGDIKALCDVLIRANVNSLLTIQRERVAPNDAEGPQTDYLGSAVGAGFARADPDFDADFFPGTVSGFDSGLGGGFPGAGAGVSSQSNELAVLTPYQITFRSFSREIAKVLAGLASSPYGFIVETIDVEPAAPTTFGQPGMTPAAPMTYYTPQPPAPTPRSGRSRAMDEAAEAAALRPDLFGPGKTPPPAYTPPAYTPPPATAPPSYASPAYAASGAPIPAPSASPTGLRETQLRVTLLVQVVRLLPKM